MLKKVLCLLFSTFFFTISYGQTTQSRWVDSVFNALTVNEKIGQLFMVKLKATSKDAVNDIETNIKIHNAGSVIFPIGSPANLAQIANNFQEESAVPLFIAKDASLGAMIDTAQNFATPFMLGAINNDTMTYKTASLLAAQLKMIGVNFAFQPLTEVIDPSQTATFNYNSFGQSKVKVANHSLALMRGLQDNGIMACAKYFSAEALSVVDVEKGVPVLNIKVDSLQTYPYAPLFKNGLSAVLPATLNFPLFYDNVNISKKNTFNASTLTSAYTGPWIKKNMNYTGLTITDIEKIQLTGKGNKAGDAELLAFQAGNDILMSPKDIGAATRKIRRLVRKEKQYMEQLDATVKKILEAKFKAGLWRDVMVNTENLDLRLQAPEGQLLKQKVYEQAITVLRNEQEVLPITILENKSFGYVSTALSTDDREFHNMLSNYIQMPYYAAGEKTDFIALLDSIEEKSVIIISIFPDTPQTVYDRLLNILKPLFKQSDIIFCDFGNQNFLKSAGSYATAITAYTNDQLALKTMPQILFGALPARGELPLNIETAFKEGHGIKTSPIKRLAYSIPEDAGVDSRILSKIDTIANEAIKIGATPGCQVFVAKDGKVIYQKAFGHLTYDKTIPVTNQTIYDLASVTKVSATLQTAMFMYERRLINLHRKVSYYLPELKKTNKKDITLLDMLTHQSGLLPFIPLWPNTVKDTTFLPLYYSRVKNTQYPLQVSNNLYASPNIKDSVWVWIGKSKLGEKPLRTPYSYKYSDLGFLILQQVAERLLNQPMDEFLHQNLYEPLGAFTTGFTPLSRFPKQEIAPTEDDKIFRRTFVSGTVHDERAAMLGGVAGHAGLFSNANDLGKLGQMLLQEGYYGGYQYYRPQTVRYFTAKKFTTSRRGIGWDKPIQSDWNSPTSLLASPKTFGHTGFTGTCIWIDPEFNLVYIFLSNRVYPDRNNKLSNANIRSRIQDVIYQSIFHYIKTEDSQYIVNATLQ